MAADVENGAAKSAASAKLAQTLSLTTDMRKLLGETLEDLNKQVNRVDTGQQAPGLHGHCDLATHVSENQQASNDITSNARPNQRLRRRQFATIWADQELGALEELIAGLKIMPIQAKMLQKAVIQKLTDGIEQMNNAPVGVELSPVSLVAKLQAAVTPNRTLPGEVWNEIVQGHAVLAQAKRTALWTPGKPQVVLGVGYGGPAVEEPMGLKRKPGGFGRAIQQVIEVNRTAAVEPVSEETRAAAGHDELLGPQPASAAAFFQLVKDAVAAQKQASTLDTSAVKDQLHSGQDVR